MGRIDDALQNFMHSLRISRELNDDSAVGYALNNIGTIFEAKGVYDSTLVYYQGSMQCYQNIGDSKGVLQNLNDMGAVYNKIGDYDLALDVSEAAFDRAVAVDNQDGEATALMNMGVSYAKTKNFGNALDVFIQSRDLSMKIGRRELLKDNYFHLSDVYEQLGDYKKSTMFLKLFDALKDSLFNEQTAENTDRLRITYETAKKERENELLRKVNESQQDVIRKTRLIILLTSGMSGVIAVLAVILYTLYRQKNKANILLGATNSELSLQRDELDRQKSEIQEAISKIKALSGLLPICASCKKIRDDSGYWREVESYISDHSEALFSHGICPDCLKKLYPEYYHPSDDPDRSHHPKKQQRPPDSNAV